MPRQKPTQSIIGKEFVWNHNPKTGGTAFTVQCLEHGIGEKLYIDFWTFPDRPIGAHLTFPELQEFRSDLPELSISFVRNPVDWLQSFFNQLYKNRAVTDINSFARMMDRTPPQREYLRGVSEVLRYEELDMLGLLARLAKLEGVKPPTRDIVKNKSNPNVPRLSESDLRQLEPYWKPDAEFFGY